MVTNDKEINDAQTHRAELEAVDSAPWQHNAATEPRQRFIITLPPAIHRNAKVLAAVRGLSGISALIADALDQAIKTAREAGEIK